MSQPDLPVISLFSGALGLDLGVEQAGFSIRVAVECNKAAAATIRKNRPDIHVIEEKIEKVTTEEILQAAKLRPGETMLVTGGPSCQAFSTAGKRGSLSDPRGVLFRHFLRVVKEVRPRFFLMENVRGVLSAAIKHRPLKERGPGYPPLTPDEELGSALKRILEELKTTEYYTIFDLLNAASFGVPQVRHRVLFIGSRDGEPITMPEPTHFEQPPEGQARWVTLGQCLERHNDPSPVYSDFPPSKKKYLDMVPEGGNWRNLPTEYQKEALGGAYVSWGGRSGFLRRLARDRPCPALTTDPAGRATTLCHPTETRPLSAGEYAAIQQYSMYVPTWQFVGSISQQYIQIGNAVPLGFGKAIGEALQKVMIADKRDDALLGTVECKNTDLLTRISKRPRTILNPPRMRKEKDIASLRKWLNGRGRQRVDIWDYAANDSGVQMLLPGMDGDKDVDEIIAELNIAEYIESEGNNIASIEELAGSTE